MITAVGIRGFQSIKDVELELKPFTVIVGPSSVGKSAAFRAIKAAMTNRAGSDFVRRGDSEAVVLIETDSHTVLWNKPRTGGATYIVDDSELTKTGRSVPELVEEALGMRVLEIDSTMSITPQVHSQFDGQFLLTETPGRAAKVLAKLTRLDVLLKAEIAAAKDLRKVRDAAKTCSASIDISEANEKDLTHQLEGRAARLEGTQGSLNTAQKLLESIETAESVVAKLQDVRELPETPSEEEIESLSVRILELSHGLEVCGSLKEIEAGLEDSEKTLRELSTETESIQGELSKIKTCPLCGSSLKEGLSDHID